MAYRFLFRNSHVGCLCKPINPYSITKKLVPRKGNITIAQDERKHKIYCIPLRCNSSKKFGSPLTKHCTFKQLKKLKSKSPVNEDDASDYHRLIDEINYGPYFSQRHNRAKIKKKRQRQRSTLNEMGKMCALRNSFHEMESYFIQMRNINDDMNSFLTTTLREDAAGSSAQQEIQQLIQDLDLKIQNDIWKQSEPKILNNLNSKNDTWKLIYGHRQAPKDEDLKNLPSGNMWKKFIQTPELRVTETGTENLPR